MAGARNDIPEILQRLDAFALPSLAEGVPYTLLEAMATSLPIVASKVGGMLELIEDGVNGILLPPGNPENWAKAILRLFESPSEELVWEKLPDWPQNKNTAWISWFKLMIVFI